MLWSIQKLYSKIFSWVHSRIFTHVGRARSSPEVWAAVRILGDFVSSQDREASIPDNILTAIILLTQFLDEDTEEIEDQDVVQVQGMYVGNLL